MTRAEQKLRVLTWNIHRGVGIDFRHDIQRIVNVLDKIDADIVALQEVDLRAKSAQSIDLLKILKKQAGDYCCHAWTIKDKRGKYGHVLFSKYPLKDQFIHDVSVYKREPRAVIETIMQLAMTKVRILAIHLGLGIGDKARQLTKLQDIIGTSDIIPTIIMGDFNEWWPGQLDELFAGRFQVDNRSRSFPSFFPLLSLDRILCSKEFQVLDIKTVTSACWASDHLPIMAELEYST